MDSQSGTPGELPGPFIETRTFIGRQAETEDSLSKLSPDSQAGMRQFSLERQTGYGIDYADAIELRARVLRGEAWQSAATDLAELCLAGAERAPTVAGAPTHVACLRRASALLRMSQALMLSDTDERREIFARAARLYGEAAHMAGDCEAVTLETAGKPLKGWLHPARGAAVGSVIVIGGVEGWAMDFASQGQAFADRGIDAFLLDGPGQGESRFAHHHYLSPHWREAYSCAIDHLERRSPGRPIGFVGHSMGGSFAMAVAVDDKRIRACCNNGGPFAPWLVPQGTTFFSKMMAFCGVETPEEAVERWKTVTPGAKGPNAGYPLLMVQGGEDPMVTNPVARILYDQAPTTDKRMVIFSDGDHCIYRHKQDRDILITDWMRERLAGAGGPSASHGVA